VSEDKVFDLKEKKNPNEDKSRMRKKNLNEEKGYEDEKRVKKKRFSNFLRNKKLFAHFFMENRMFLLFLQVLVSKKKM